MEAARSPDLAMRGYVCSGPALWMLESFWSRSWPPKADARRLLATCYICTWLDCLTGPRLVEFVLCTTKSSDVLLCATKSLDGLNPNFAHNIYIHVHLLVFFLCLYRALRTKRHSTCAACSTLVNSTRNDIVWWRYIGGRECENEIEI